MIPRLAQGRSGCRHAARVAAALARRDFEIVVADDGSGSGNTAEAALALEPARTARAAAPGTTAARATPCRRGRRYSERRDATDADLAAPMRNLARLEAALRAGADVAIGS